ncbi:MAG: single-stranded DNA-binding protein [Gammaproteobacteria bacterium]|nr:single-stranded DNA-binding protein [Gammaproteobacteria bacterium]
MINRVILVGRITKDPELKMTQANIPVVTFTLAVNRQFSNADGDREADFISCVVWRKQAENMRQYVHKGDMLGVEGRIQTRQYDTDNGMRYVTEIVCDSVQFLESKQEWNNEEARQVQRSYDDAGSKEKSNDEMYETSKKLAAEEDLPF